MRPHALTDAAQAGSELADLCVQAVSTAAWDLGLDPALFAGELAQGEIGMLIHYLARAAEHVPELETRERMQALVHRLTDWTGAEEA
ncbi:hypothetical protein SAMN05216486_12411 [bacterium JGI 053]|nr:hypothetical protein SAMN05216486_12411 [bacterium JGI 053]